MKKEPGAKIVYDVRASRAVRDRVEAAGGVALMNRVGHAFIKKRMRDEKWHEAFVFFKHEDAGTGPKLATRLLELTAKDDDPPEQRKRST